VSVSMLVVVFALGAGAIAIWIEARYGKADRPGLVRALAHALAAFVLLQVLPFGMGAVVADESIPLRLVALFGLALPGLTYAFLTWIWLLKVMRAAQPFR
jgi:hypothetical protein